MILVHFLDGWSGTTSTTSTTWSSSSSSSWHASSHSSHVGHSFWHSSCLVQLRDDRIANSFDLLLLVLELVDFSKLVSIEPLDSLVTLVSDGLHIILGYLILDLVIIERSFHVEAVALKFILSRNPVLLLVILSLELLSVIHHPLYLLLGQAALVIGDSDLVLLASTLVSSGDVQDTIGVDIEGHLDLRNTSWSRRDSSQIELTKVVVVLGHGPLTFVDLDSDSWLVVRVGGEGLSLLGRNSGVPLDEAGHYSSSSLDTKRQGSYVKQQKVRHFLTRVSSKDSSLDSCSIGHSFIRVDGPVQLLPVEEVLEQLLDLGNPSGASNQDNVIDGAFIHLGISHGFLHRLQSALE